MDRARRSLAETARTVLAEIPGSDGVGVTMLLPDGPAYGGANAFTERVDAVQYTLMEGPCVSAADTGEPVRFRVRDPGERRWPGFVERTRALSLREVVSVPLLHGTRVIGSLNVYSRADDRLRDLHETEAARLAARVRPAVWNSRTLVVAATNSRLLRQAAHDRADIERGVAWLMRYYAVNAEQARILLGQISRDQDSSEADTARRLLTSDGRGPASSA